MTETQRPALSVALKRGIKRQCPNCGEGKLFATYLKQVQNCAKCGEAFGHIRPDDAAPWLTILLVGHMVGPAALMVEKDSTWPFWVSMTLWPVLAFILCMLVLPLAKGAFISAIWATRATDEVQAATGRG